MGDFQSMESCEYLIGDALTAICICVRQQKCKFFTPIASSQIGSSVGLLGDGVGDSAQAIIAGLMAITIIEFFKVIDVNEEQR